MKKIEVLLKKHIIIVAAVALGVAFFEVKNVVTVCG